MSSQSSWKDSPLRAEREKRLRETWRYARERSPYYRRILPAIDYTKVDESHLQELPILGRDDLAANLDELRCLTTMPDWVAFTGGSSGMPAMIYGTRPPTATAIPATSARRPLRIMTDGGHHGTASPSPAYTGTIQVPLRNLKNYEWIYTLLTKVHHFDGFDDKVTSLVLPLPALKKLVHLLIEEDHDLHGLALRMVVTYAWHLSRPWRSLIEGVLRTKLIDQFGFTENRAGSAMECLVCGWYHYGPQVVWEVLDTRTLKRLDTGIGKLVVTTLYPHAQDQILFRYESGDLVELGPYCEEAGDRGFRFRGRISQSFSIQTRAGWNWILFPTDIQELVDFDANVARYEEPRFSGVTRSHDDAFPKWRIRSVMGDNGSAVVHVDIEMKWCPWLFHEAWTTFSSRLSQGILDRSPALARLQEEGGIQLVIKGHAPGSLADHDIFIC
jgi:hypothetical protein